MKKGQALRWSNGVTLHIAKPLLKDMSNEGTLCEDASAVKHVPNLRFAHVRQLWPWRRFCMGRGSQKSAPPNELYSHKNKFGGGGWVTPYLCELFMGFCLKAKNRNSCLTLGEDVLQRKRNRALKTDCEVFQAPSISYSF